LKAPDIEFEKKYIFYSIFLSFTWICYILFTLFILLIDALKEGKLTMIKRKLLISLVQLIFALFALVATSFAWFAVSQNAGSQGIDLQVVEGAITSYEIQYFTPSSVYKYNDNTNDMYEYSDTTQTWVLLPREGVGAFEGVFLSPFDNLIPQNNVYNNLYIEFHITYDVDVNTYLILSARSDFSLIDQLLIESSSTNFLSEYVNIQYMTSTAYSSRSTGSNIFYDLFDDFHDINGNLITPVYDFYDNSNVYQTSVDFLSTILLTPSGSEVYLYYNFSYIESKIQALLTSLNIPLTTTELFYVSFYQDVMLVIRESEE